MNLRAEESKWESDALGIRVGVLTIKTDDISQEAIRLQNRSLFDVVFVRCAAWIDPKWPAVALDYLYEMEAVVRGPGFSAETRIVVAPAASEQHVAIAREAFSDSRFLRDPRLSQKSAARYVRWLFGRRPHVLEDAPDAAFALIQNDQDEAGRISTIAVDRYRRSEGLGSRLVYGIFAADPTRGVWRVRVSARNHRAVRFYGGMGFIVKSVFTIFHVWTEWE